MSRVGERPVLAAIRSTTGIKMATTPVGAHYRAHQGDDDHQQHQELQLAAAALGAQPVSQPLGDAGAGKTLADREHGGDQHHGGIAEPRQDIGDIQDSGERQDHDRHQRDRIAAGAIECECENGRAQEA